MANVKKQLLDEIDRRIARKREMKDRAAQRNTVEAFVVSFIKNIEDINMVATDPLLWQVMANVAVNALHDQLKTIDSRCDVNVTWCTAEGQKPAVNGVTIRWSRFHVLRHDVEPELFIDAAEMLFL